MSKIAKRYQAGTKLKITYEANHDFTYYGTVTAVDEGSVTVKIGDDGSKKPLRCVPTDYGDEHFECEDGRFFDFDIVREKRKIMTSQLIEAAAVLMCFTEEDKHYIGGSVGVDMRLRYAKALEEKPNKGFELRVRILDAVEEACQSEEEVDVTEMLTKKDRRIVLALLGVA